LVLGNSLPLGLDPKAVYAESSIQMTESAQLTLMSDGVVETRRKDGELLGFYRAQALSAHSPSQIAQAAQDFGQEDDITVVQLRWQAAAQETTTALKAAWSPASA
jgi:sigma-B regulation protein RsbU (phosphoserine phosphatase)